MDLWSIYLNNANPTPLLLRNTAPEIPITYNFRKTLSYRLDTARIFGIRDSKRNNVCKHRSIALRAIGKKNHDDSSSSSSGNNDNSNAEDDMKQEDASVEDKKSKEETPNSKTLDWREFRASLFSREQVEAIRLGSPEQDGNHQQSKPLGLKWAHPISSPESGCVLVATEKLDGVRTFERTVVLLLRSGTRHAQEGPFGVIINRPLHKKIRHMKPSNLDLATTFADCCLNFGGPLEASMFLSKTGEKTKLAGFEEVIPGLCFGARNSLDEAAGLVKKGVLKPQDFKFFVGYAGWQLDQLREEIESDYWYVAACSADMIFGAVQNSSQETLWEEILQLMGGHYSELSRKPKQDM
ncbi:uncharacterized protein LOC124931148 [Impatiens glandulifera]|uniref:uncharacterized protein LOC124931148 n=1 Tax=Impatiens glandulifera TaxID=253017 RepID=UPI001FB05982|nr:uncharacterized protein LOC124931148 [Impatiens glandulifera]